MEDGHRFTADLFEELNDKNALINNTGDKDQAKNRNEFLQNNMIELSYME